MNLDLEKRGLLKSTVFEDNNGCLSLAKAPKLTPRTKHIAVKYHFFKSHIDTTGTSTDGIHIVKIDTKEQKADIFTKGLGADDYTSIRGLLMGW